MKTFIYTAIILISALSVNSGQDTTVYKDNIEVCTGYLSTLLTDEYVSPNEYSGRSTVYGLSWGDYNSNRIIHLGVLFNRINELRNNQSTASASSFLFNYRHLYHVAHGSFLSKQTDFYLGPGLSVAFYSRTQNFLPVKSDIGFFSLNFDAAANIILSRNLSVSAGLLFTALSMLNKSKSGHDGFKISSVLSFQNISLDITCRYDITGLVFIHAGYNFRYIRITDPDYLRLIEDKAMIGIGVSF